MQEHRRTIKQKLTTTHLEPRNKQQERSVGVLLQVALHESFALPHEALREVLKANWLLHHVEVAMDYAVQELDAVMRQPKGDSDPEKEEEEEHTLPAGTERTHLPQEQNWNEAEASADCDNEAKVFVVAEDYRVVLFAKVFQESEEAAVEVVEASLQRMRGEIPAFRAVSTDVPFSWKWKMSNCWKMEWKVDTNID